MWKAATPARSIARTVRSTLAEPPKPVSASATTGRPPASTIFSTRSITSLKLSRPMSG